MKRPKLKTSFALLLPTLFVGVIGLSTIPAITSVETQKEYVDASNEEPFLVIDDLVNVYLDIGHDTVTISTELIGTELPATFEIVDARNPDKIFIMTYVPIVSVFEKSSYTITELEPGKTYDNGEFSINYSSPNTPDTVESSPLVFKTLSSPTYSEDSSEWFDVDHSASTTGGEVISYADVEDTTIHIYIEFTSLLPTTIWSIFRVSSDGGILEDWYTSLPPYNTNTGFILGWDSLNPKQNFSFQQEVALIGNELLHINYSLFTEDSSEDWGTYLRDDHNSEENKPVPPVESSDGMSMGAIIGISLGALAFVGLVGGLGYWKREEITNLFKKDK